MVICSSRQFLPCQPWQISPVLAGPSPSLPHLEWLLVGWVSLYPNGSRGDLPVEGANAREGQTLRDGLRHFSLSLSLSLSVFLSPSLHTPPSSCSQWVKILCDGGYVKIRKTCSEYYSIMLFSRGMSPHDDTPLGHYPFSLSIIPTTLSKQTTLLSSARRSGSKTWAMIVFFMSSLFAFLICSAELIHVSSRNIKTRTAGPKIMRSRSISIYVSLSPPLLLLLEHRAPSLC